MGDSNNPAPPTGYRWREIEDLPDSIASHADPELDALRAMWLAEREHLDPAAVSAVNQALVREWEEHDLMCFARVIAGQELGTKKEHIHLATDKRYASDKILMIGDAPGDQSAAKGNSAHFYPINPGHEEASWERFYKEAYPKFINGTFGGKYETDLIREFEALLPSVPPWK